MGKVSISIGPEGCIQQMDWFGWVRGVSLLNSGASVEMAEGWIQLWQWPEGLALTLSAVEDLLCRTRGKVTAIVSSAVKAHPRQGDGLHLVWGCSVGCEFFPESLHLCGYRMPSLIPAGQGSSDVATRGRGASTLINTLSHKLCKEAK